MCVKLEQLDEQLEEKLEEQFEWLENRVEKLENKVSKLKRHKALLNHELTTEAHVCQTIQTAFAHLDPTLWATVTQQARQECKCGSVSAGGFCRQCCSKRRRGPSVKHCQFCICLQ
jgi:predicted nuclease with TOPRIM domain